MKITVLDAATFGDDIDLSLFSQFGELRIIDMTTRHEIATNCVGADVIVLNKVKINRTTLPRDTSVKLICVAATGVDNIDLDFCRELGIAVCNVKGYSTDSVAQVTVAMALSLVCHLPSYNRFVSSGEYSATKFPNHLEPFYHEIEGMTWGIVGYGNIAKRVARVADALGCHVAVYSRTPAPDRENLDIDELCRRADILSIHVPLNDGTRNLISRDRIALMKPTAIVVNVARGAVTDEEALADAILSGHLGGLGVDVYSKEPFGKEHPFSRILSCENVCLTPHMAWGSVQARARCVGVIADNIRSFLEGGDKNRKV
jgi:glycerate dehydrogenase